MKKPIFEMWQQNLITVLTRLKGPRNCAKKQIQK